MKINCNSFFDGDFDYLNLNEFYVQNKALITDTKNPGQIQVVLNSLNKNTYGGYGENRKDIWKGTYLDDTGGYIHLGIDINAVAGTDIKAPFDCRVFQKHIDLDENIGWGGRLTLEIEEDICEADDYQNPLLVLGHIDPQSIKHTIGNNIRKGEIIGKVGTWPTNGNTFQHLHVQCVCHTLIDGYGTKRDLEQNPNPFEIDFL